MVRITTVCVIRSKSQIQGLRNCNYHTSTVGHRSASFCQYHTILCCCNGVNRNSSADSLHSRICEPGKCVCGRTSGSCNVQYCSITGTNDQIRRNGCDG